MHRNTSIIITTVIAIVIAIVLIIIPNIKIASIQPIVTIVRRRKEIKEDNSAYQWPRSQTIVERVRIAYLLFWRRQHE